MKAREAMSTAHLRASSPTELKRLSSQVNTIILKSKPISPRKPGMRFGGAAGYMKVIKRIRFPALRYNTSREAQRLGLHKRVHAAVAPNIVRGLPRVTGYMYEPANKRHTARIEVFTSVNKFRQELKPALVHELTHLRDYARKGTAHNLESERKAYSNQYHYARKMTQYGTEYHSINPPFETTWSPWALKDWKVDAKLQNILHDLHTEGKLKKR